METIYKFRPIRIKRLGKTILVRWNDGKADEIPLTVLRDKCPCASCNGEEKTQEDYIPIKAPFKPTGFYEIEKIVPVGNYAVNIIWKDGHNTGIYSWDILRAIGESLENNNKK